MCGQSYDDPGMHDDFTAPEPTRPRTYRLSGDAPARPMTHLLSVDSAMTIGCSCGFYDNDYAVMTEHIRRLPLGRGSVALAVLGEMLMQLESEPVSGVARLIRMGKMTVLREARDRIAAAESLA